MHVVSAVGWIGAVTSYLVLALAAVTTDSAETVRAAFVAMELLYFALVPLAAVALLTGGGDPRPAVREFETPAA